MGLKLGVYGIYSRLLLSSPLFSIKHVTYMSPVGPNPFMLTCTLCSSCVHVVPSSPDAGPPLYSLPQGLSDVGLTACFVALDCKVAESLLLRLMFGHSFHVVVVYIACTFIKHEKVRWCFRCFTSCYPQLVLVLLQSDGSFTPMYTLLNVF
jgi:hypothetical protein